MAKKKSVKDRFLLKLKKRLTYIKHRSKELRLIWKGRIIGFLTSQFLADLFFATIYSAMLMFILTLFGFSINWLLFVAAFSLYWWYQEVMSDVKDIVTLRLKSELAFVKKSKQDRIRPGEQQ